MRVGFVLDESFDNPDGIQQYIQQLGMWLTAEGHEVYYLVGQTERQDIAGIYSVSRNVKVKFNGNWLSMPLPVPRAKLQQVLDELKLDVLHVQVPYSPFMAGRLIKLAPSSTAVVGTFHILPYSWLATVGSMGLRLLNVRTARRFDAMVAVSEPARRFARRGYGYHCEVVPNTFDYARFAPTKKSATPPGKTIVFLGRLVQRKGVHHLLEALNELKQSSRLPAGWRLIIGGKGELTDVLQSAVKRYGLQRIVRFEGFIAEADKPAFLARADIAVFPSTAGESFGISLLEAMAAARGVVLAGDNPGYSSVMSGFTDQLFDPRRTSAFADLLECWMSQSDERVARAKEQRAYVQRFDEQIVGREIAAVYEKALQKRRAP